MELASDITIPTAIKRHDISLTVAPRVELSCPLLTHFTSDNLYTAVLWKTVGGVILS